jgi:hypothetical protein
MPDEYRFTPFYAYREVSDGWTDPETGAYYNNDDVPVWRWRRAMFNDFKTRWDWCVRPYAEANHHPIAAIDGDKSDSIVRLTAQGAEQLSFDASASTDPDGDDLVYRWWIYPEAGTYAGSVQIETADQPNATLTIPSGADGTQIHLILEIHDKNAIAELYDYRRIVIDVEGAMWKGGVKSPSMGTESSDARTNQ